MKTSRALFVAMLAVAMTLTLVGEAAASTATAPTTRHAGSSAGIEHSAPAKKKKKKHKKKKSTTSTTVAAAAATVKVGNTALGSVIVDTDGRTLYVLDRDQGSASVCTAGCQTIWPPLTATGSPTAGTGVDPALLSHAMQADGKDQVTYAGHLLYRFANDTVAGDTKGTAVPGWHAVSPAGTAVGG